MSDSTTIMLPDGSELDLSELSEDELLELYQSYEENSLTSVGTLVGGGFTGTLDSCLGPTTWQTMEVAAKLFSLCLILRVLLLLSIPTRMKHLVSCLTGIATFVIFFSENSMVYHLLALCAGGYMLLLIVTKHKGAVVSLFCVAFLLTCEVLVVAPEDWNPVKGTFMVLSMKIISFSFDAEKGVTAEFPGVLEYSGYVLCPSSIIFGPFMMYKDYCQILHHRPLTLTWFLSLVKSISLGYIFLILSSCVCPWIFPEDSNKWLLAYQTALSFRCSNYFVGFLSESSCLLCGIGTVVKEEKEEKLEWKVPVSRPQHVEFPRSFVEIAIHWSVPNHVFLKNYVFKRARGLGPFLSMFITFAASSILHGLSFQIAAVLISIATYAYVEHAFRRKISRIFDMCVEARKCKSDCTHKFKEFNYWVIVTNLAFGFLNAFHLAYLGVMFDGNISERGYGVEHTLKKWSELKYTSHWIVLAMYIVSVVL